MRSLFVALLRLFPPWFRERHGEEMVALVEARLARSTSAWARLGVWRRAMADVLGAAWAVRRRDRYTPSLESHHRKGRMGPLATDLRNAIRHLVRAPGFTVGAVALLAVGIGANATVFSIVDALLFRPPPWTDVDRVVHIYQDSDDGEPSSTSFPAYRDMAELDVFEAVGAATQMSVELETPDGDVELSVEYITASYLDVIGLLPMRGRWFEARHDQVGSEFAAVMSWTAWTSRFGSDPDIVGRTLQLNGQPVTVIGVGPRDLPSTSPPFVTDLWLSISSTPVSGDWLVGNLERRADHWYQIRARLAPGVEFTQASSAMDALATRLAADFPEFNRNRGITVFPARDVRTHPQGDGDLFRAGTLLAAITTVILLLACANLANLLLVRGLGRSGEMAVRRAMGANAFSVARLFILESFLLALGGGILGLLLTAWAIRLVPSLPLTDVLPGLMDLRIDARLLGFSFLLVAATAGLFGALPAFRAGRQGLAGVLRDDRRTSSLGRGTLRLRNALVAIQVAASLLLVMGTGMLVRGLSAVQSIDTGVDVDQLAWVRTDLSVASGDAEERRVLMSELLEHLAGQPGVEAVAATSRLPALSSSSTTTIVEGYVPAAGTEAIELDFGIVDDAYFATVGLEVVEGRTFSVDDQAGAGTTIVVNETAARRFWGEESALGRRMRGQGSENWRTVIGVVADAPVNTLAEDPQPFFYFSERQTGGIAAPFVVMRTAADPARLLTGARAQLVRTHPALEVEGQGTLADHFGETLSGTRFATTLLGAFSLLAAVLAGLGIYAVVSFGVARRASELGIRMALGAGAQRVVRMVVRDVAGTVAVGLALGLAAAVVVMPQLAALAYGAEGTDPVTYSGAIVVISLVAGLAAWLPARRAARADPVQALRRS